MATGAGRMVTEMRILGLDAAFANTGLALCRYELSSNRLFLDEVGLIKTGQDKVNKKVVRRNSDDLRRAGEVIKAVDEVIARFKPNFIVCEVPFGAQSARAAWALGISVGLIAHAASRVPLIQVTPKEVKDVVGEKFPDKAQMIQWATKTFPTANWPVRGGKVVAGSAEHMADAVAAVHAGIQTDEFKRALAMLQMMRAA
jgi:Holliday junction resolvasome RuvABC endonuclease subunit